jgi:catechol 2,3-dioxygenase-like lactoylglutathione lyase family enzyme
VVDEVETSVAFYTQHLGFDLEWAPVTHDPVAHPAPVFAAVSHGDLRLLLTTPDSPIMAAEDGPSAEPGGWNRISIPVDDLDAEIERLREAGVSFRHEVITGPGGRQIVVDDPSGNAVELFEWNRIVRFPPRE